MTDISNLDFSLVLTEPSLSQSSIIADYSEYSGESIDSIIGNINKHKNATAEEFNNLVSIKNNKWNAQTEFYKTSYNYIYDLLTVNASHEGVTNKLNKFIPSLLKNMNEMGNTFADFGAGIGIVCEIMYRWGNKKVTYIDIESPITEFAKWRFKKYNLDIEMIIIPQNDFMIDKKFDIVFTDAVWEHLTPTQQISYSIKLADMVKENGTLVFIVDAEGESQEMPMHYDVNIEKIFTEFISSGLSRPHLNKVLVNNKPNGTIIPFATIWCRVKNSEVLVFNQQEIL